MKDIVFQDFIYLLKNKIRGILLFSLLFGAIGFVSSAFLIPKWYEADTKIIIGMKIGDEDKEIELFTSQAQVLNTYKETLNSRYVAQKVITALGLRDTVEDFQRNIKIELPKQTNIIRILVTYTDPEKAAAIANQMGEIAISDLSTMTNVKNVDFLDKAEIPKKAAGPHLVRNTFLGTMMGLFLGLLVLVLFHGREDTVRKREQLERLFGIPVTVAVAKFHGELYGRS